MKVIPLMRFGQTFGESLRVPKTQYGLLLHPASRTTQGAKVPFFPLVMGWSLHTYDETTFLMSDLLTRRGADNLQALHCTYDPSGSVSSIWDNAQQSIYLGIIGLTLLLTLLMTRLIG